MNTPNFVAVLSGVALATSGMVFGLCLPSSAAELWNWSYSGGGSQGGSGTFTTNDGPGTYLITGITGTAENSPITGLLAPGSLGDNDNLLLPTYSPQLSPGGISFQTLLNRWNLQGQLVCIPGVFGCAYELAAPNAFYVGVTFRATGRPPITPFCRTPLPCVSTPEPSSLLSFITLGGLILGGAVRGARK